MDDFESELLKSSKRRAEHLSSPDAIFEYGFREGAIWSKRNLADYTKAYEQLQKRFEEAVEILKIYADNQTLALEKFLKEDTTRHAKEFLSSLGEGEK